MDELLELYNYQIGSEWKSPLYLLKSLIELFGIYRNSSYTVNLDGRIVENGIIFNCSKTSSSQEYMEYTIFGYCVLLVMLYSLMKKRVSFKTDVCQGRPGLVLPMNMLNSHDFIFEYTLVFLSLSEEIFNYIFGMKLEFGPQIPLLKFFIKFALVFAFSIISYPAFSAISARQLFCYATVLISSIVYFTSGIIAAYTLSFCLEGVKKIPYIFTSVVYGSIDISIVFLFTWKIIAHIQYNGWKNKEIKQFRNRNIKYCNMYVKQLFSEKTPEKSIKDGALDEVEDNFIMNTLDCNELRMKVKERIYKPIPGFSIPPRLMIGIAVGLYFSYRICIDEIFRLTPTAWNMISNLQKQYPTTKTNLKSSFQLIFGNNSQFSNQELQNSYRYLTFFYTHLLIGCFICGLIIAFFNSMVQTFLLLRNYRLHFHGITKKGFSELIDIKQAPPPHSLILGFVKYSGFQAAYTLWGIIVVSVFMFCLLYFLIGIFMLPLIYVENSWSRKLVYNYGPVLVASILFNFIQSLVVKHFFTKEKGTIMEVDNRQIFMIYTHCSFFLNAMMGIFSSIKRIIIWIFSGVFCFSRIDFSGLPDYIHGFDSGYMCYIGFIYTEQYHFNPILQCFANILIRTQSETKNGTSILLQKPAIVKERNRYRNIWYVAVTLINNPKLTLERKQFLKTDSILK